MPNELRVREVLTEAIVGGQTFHGLHGCVSMPDALYRSVKDDATRAILHMVAAAIDWPRLLQGAAMRHGVVHPDKPGDPNRPSLADELVCGSCIRHSLLSETGNEGSSHEWARKPDVDLDGHVGVDWPVIVAQAVRHRRLATSVVENPGTAGERNPS